MESMGAQLKQKEGELLQLQVLLSEQSKLKETMTKELTRLTILADQVMQEKLSCLYLINFFFKNESLTEEIAHLKEELSKLQQKYDTMLTVSFNTFKPISSF